MNIGSLSAGTGPAAAILGGVVLVTMGNPVGWILIIAGIVLSLIWSGKFS